MFRTLRRFTSEATSSVVKNGLMSIASMIVVIFCLFIFGVFAILTINVNYLGEQIADQCQLQAYLDETITEEAIISDISSQIDDISYIKDKTFVTGKEIFDNFKKDLDPEQRESFEGVPDEVISDSFQITLTDISHADEVADALSKIEGIQSVDNRQGLINIIENSTRLVKNISIWVVIIFALISIFIISNTIKLTVHNRRKEINIMKYVGATDSYIRGPFVVEGIIVGLISAVLAFFATQYVYTALQTAILNENTMGQVVSLKSFWEMAPAIAISYAVLGLGLGMVGSAVSIRKYLKV